MNIRKIANEFSATFNREEYKLLLPIYVIDKYLNEKIQNKFVDIYITEIEKDYIIFEKQIARNEKGYFIDSKYILHIDRELISSSDESTYNINISTFLAIMKLDLYPSFPRNFPHIHLCNDKNNSFEIKINTNKIYLDSFLGKKIYPFIDEFLVPTELLRKYLEVKKEIQVLSAESYNNKLLEDIAITFCVPFSVAERQIIQLKNYMNKNVTENYIDAFKNMREILRDGLADSCKHISLDIQIESLLKGKYSHLNYEDLHHSKFEIIVDAYNKNKENRKYNSFNLIMTYEQLKSFDEVCQMQKEPIIIGFSIKSIES